MAMGSHRILVVDDDGLLALDTSTTLTRAGYEVVGPFSSVATALEGIRRRMPEAALLDVMLHNEMSFPIARELAHAHVPFVFVTGQDRDELPEPFRSRPLLPKPCGQNALLKALVMLLRRE